MISKRLGQGQLASLFCIISFLRFASLRPRTIFLLVFTHFCLFRSTEDSACGETGCHIATRVVKYLYISILYQNRLYF